MEALEMKTTNEFIDAIKAKHGLTSDYQLAKRLAISTSCIGNYRSGRSRCDDAVAIKIAAELDLHPVVVLAAVHCERAKTPAKKAAWKEIYEKWGGMAAMVMLGIMLNGTIGTKPASASVQARLTGDQSIHYTKSRRKKRRYNPLEFLVHQQLMA